MWKLSPFHSLVSSNYKELYDEYMNGSNASFYKKYKVGATLVNYYFGWAKKKLYNLDQTWRLTQKYMLEDKKNGNYHYNLY